MFESTVLDGAERQLARMWDELPQAVPGVDIRFVMTHAVPVFPALVIYGIRLDDETIELVDITIDDDYFDLVDSDPD